MNVIDLRSDTVTKPTEEMRQAMLTCAVGDDVYGDDPTVTELENLAAKTLGKEAALFVPSGTMGNQLAIMTHTRRGDEIIVSKDAHIVWHECGAASVLSGVSYNIADSICAETVRRGIRGDDIHYPRTGLVCAENALGNGRVVPLEIMKEVYAVSAENNIPVHLDGARIFNAAAALGVPACDIAAYADSIMFCVSKGLCAPVGSLLCGTQRFVDSARRNRKLLGGGMRQAGVLAVCGIIALEKMTARLSDDHENAKILADALSSIPYVTVDHSSVEINMVFFDIDTDSAGHDRFVRYMLENGVKINPADGDTYRFVTHNDITAENIRKTVEIMNGYTFHMR